MRVSHASEADWAAARAAWESGLGWSASSQAIEGRAAATTIRRRAINEGWTRPDGLDAAPTIEQRREANEHAAAAAVRKWIDEKDRIAGRLIGLADTLLTEVTAPYEMVEVKVVPQGKENGSEVETVRTRLTSPTPADKQRLVTSTAILLDKLLLLSGEATSRTETMVDRDAMVTRARQLRDELGERRSAKEIQDGASTG